MHYAYAVIMLVALFLLRTGFTGRARRWWSLALVIQFWHHIEHLLLIIQASTHQFFFGGKVPTSVLQIFFPRVELHLFYNTIVFIPMVVAMIPHVVWLAEAHFVPLTYAGDTYSLQDSSQVHQLVAGNTMELYKLMKEGQQDILEGGKGQLTSAASRPLVVPPKEKKSWIARLLGG